MNNYIKLLRLPIVFGLMPFAGFAQYNPSDNIPIIAPIVQPVTITYPDISYIGSSLPVNYIRTEVPDIPLDNISGNGTHVRQMTRYFDGLGRPLQEVAKRAHADGYDLVQPHGYDSAGRERYQFLPYVLPVELSTGKLNRSVSSKMHHFYDNLGPDEPPYSKTETDNFLAGRTTRKLAAGRSWVGSNRAVEYTYRSNVANEVRLWTVGAGVTALPVSALAYAPGEIVVTKVTDEDNKVRIEYKDKSGMLIMSKAAVDNNPSETSHNGYACTYYVYDDLQRLRFTIPPKAFQNVAVSGNTYSITQSVANGLCYKYYYDGRGRLAQKRVPDKAVEYYVYDQRDRLILYQDGNMRNNLKWAFTVFDPLDRPSYSGLLETDLTDQVGMQTWVDDPIVPTAPSLFYYLKTYDQNGYPQSLADCKINSYTYYDNYNELQSLPFDNNPFYNNTLPSTVVPSVLSNHTRGMQTGTKIRVMDPDHPGNDNWLRSVNYYDDKGRLIQSQSENHKGGLEISSNIYYFQGMPWRNILRHQNPLAEPVPGVTDGPVPDIVVVKTFERNLTEDGGNDQVYHISQKIGNGINYDFAFYDYDHLGRVTVKQFPAANVLQEYNIRGFLTHIDVENNNNIADSQHIFEETLCYDKGFNTPLYNGNISGIKWRKAGSVAPIEAYGYTYDPLNRLTHAEYRRASVGSSNWLKNQYDFTASNINYDVNGNLQSMDQEVPDMQPSSTPMHMDQLTYAYVNNSNRLEKVTDGVPSSTTQLMPDFKDNPTDYGTEYAYDVNGNLTADSNKHISGIDYSYLNKPEQIIVDGKGTITYAYDAAGNRLQKRVHDQNTNITDTFDYIGNFVYKGNVLQYFVNEEGRTRPIAIEDGTQPPGNFTTKFVYDYFIKDHLDNVRSTVTATPIDGVYLARHEIASANIEQLLFDNIPNVRANKPGSTAIDDGFAARLDGGDAQRRIGTAIMLRTMPGDKFNISVDAFYQGESNQEETVGVEDVVSSLMGALTGGSTYAGIPVSELPDNVRTITTALNNPSLLGQLDNLINSNNNPNAPKAHLTFLVFNDKLELIPGHSGSVQVPVNPMGWTTINPSMVIGSATTGIQNGMVWTNEPGYVIIFIDNQTIGKEVWFDNLMVGHYKGEVVEESHYYPFGLTLQTSQALNAADQPLKLTTKELEKSFDLNIYDFGARMQDMQLGRWWGIDPMAEKFVYESPYVYVGNNPTSNVDFDGQVKYPVKSGYENTYKVLTSYLKNNLWNDVMHSPTIKQAYMKHSGAKDVSGLSKSAYWGDGPTLKVSDAPFGMVGSNGHYDDQKNVLEISTALAKQLENASPNDQQAALFALFVTLTHELVHYGDYFVDGDQTPGEVGWAYVWETFYYYKVKDENGKDQTTMDVEEDHTKIPDAKRMIKRKTEEGKTDVIPTVPPKEEKDKKSKKDN